jgi:hypothetical protein
LHAGKTNTNVDLNERIDPYETASDIDRVELD